MEKDIKVLKVLLAVIIGNLLAMETALAMVGVSL